MRALHDMTIPELLEALCQVEDCIRYASIADRVPALGTPHGVDAWDDICELAAEERRIVAELGRRRRVGMTVGFEAVDPEPARTMASPAARMIL